MMNRLAALLVLVVSVTLIDGCATSRVQQSTAPAPISHIVLIKLVSVDDTDAFITDSNATLAAIPGVRAYACGRPFDTGRGAPIDLNFDVACYFGFDTRTDYEAYQSHPQHQAILSRWRDRIEWIRVHDMIEAD